MTNIFHVEIALWDDIAKMLNMELVRLGYKEQKGTDPTEIVLNYFNAMLRQIAATPRTFYKSPKLEVPPALQHGFAMLVQKIESGSDITPHMSARVWKHNYTDALLNCWDIHHFHLGETTYPDNANLIERTGPVLFAKLTDTEFYAIYIEEHGEKINPTAFYDLEMIEIMHQSWPEMMNQFRCRNATNLEQKQTNEDQRLLRMNRVNSLLQTKDGTIYIPPGMGITTSSKGYGVKVVQQQLALFRQVRKLEKAILSECSKEENVFNSSSYSRPYKFTISMLSPEGIEAVEVHSGIFVSVLTILQDEGYKEILCLRRIKSKV